MCSISIISYGPSYNIVLAEEQKGTIDAFGKESMEDTRKTDKPNPFETESVVFEENLALNKKIEASSNYGTWTEEKAVDGIVSRDSRWQSGENVSVFKPVYLVLDLEKKSEISSMQIKFDSKMYGNFKIETSATKEDGSWNEVTSVDDVPVGDALNIEYNKDFTADGKASIRIERFVRLYFTNANPNSANKSIGIQELELYGSHMKEVTGNIALNKGVKASNEIGTYLAHYATDGESTEDQQRWQSGEGVSQFEPVWLEIDLEEKSEITGIRIKFARLLYGNFRIETSATNGNDANWVTLHTISDITSSSEADPPFKEWTFDTKETERHVRLYFTDVNPKAVNKSIGIREVELAGTQVLPNPPTLPSSAQQVIKEIDELRVDDKGTQVVFPKVAENYEVSLKGSDLKNIISNDGIITNYNFYDYDVDVLVQVVNKNDRAEKNLKVHIPNKKNQYPTLFPKVANPNAEPVVIPSLQEWYGYEGNFELSDQTRIIVNDKNNLGLTKVAENLKTDIKEFTGFNLEIGTGTANADDIELLSLDRDKFDVGKEGYVLLNNDNGLKIYSHTYTGALYGSITVKQVFYQQKNVDVYSFPKGIIRDYPQFEIRGVMVDVARGPYRMDMLNDLSKAFSFYKINELHVHLNDNLYHAAVEDAPDNNWEKAQKRFSSFRLESSTFPSLGPDKRKNDFFNDVQYTKEEYLNFQKNAKNQGINVISEIDAPGHALVFNKYVENNREEAAKAGITGDIRNVNNAELLALSGANYQNAEKFIRLLFDEYLGIKDGVYNEKDAVFIGDTVHIGADEYWDIKHNTTNPERNEQRANYGNYVKDMHEKVTNAGKTTRVWGHIGDYLDGLDGVNTKELNDAVIDVWYVGYENIQKRINEGYKIVNVNDSWLYGNPGRDGRDIVNSEYLYESWTPHLMSGYTVKKGEPALLGAKTALWADINQMGVTERDIFERLIRAASVVAEKTWGGTDADSTYDEFSFAFSKLYQGPGVKIASDIESTGNMVLDYNFENVTKGKVYDFTGNNYNGVMTGGKVVKEKNVNWMQFDGKSKITTSIDSLDYPYTVQFDIKLSSADIAKNEKAILFDGYDGRLSVDKNGKLLINRSIFTQDFGYTIPIDKKTNITLVGTQQVTKLYVDGKLVKTLVRRNNQERDFDYLMSTFVFPLQTIGEGFNGKLANIKVYNKAMNPQQVLDSFVNIEQTKINVSQDKGVTGHSQNTNEGGWDNADKKLHVAWKAIDGDVNTLEGTHEATESDKDSFFLGRLNNSHIALDFYRTQNVSEIVLQFDQKPSGAYTLQKSIDGVNWENIGSYSENKVTFENPISTQYLRMVGSNYKLREIEVYENVFKSELNKTIAEAKVIVDDLKLTFDEKLENEEIFKAYQLARSVYGNDMAYQKEIDTVNEVLKALLKDKVPPVTKATLSGEMLSNGTVLSQASIALQSEDKQSGVAKTEYRLNQGDWKVYKDPFIISTDGVTQIDFRSVDRVGNVEENQSIRVHIMNITFANLYELIDKAKINPKDLKLALNAHAQAAERAKNKDKRHIQLKKTLDFVKKIPDKHIDRTSKQDLEMFLSFWLNE